MPESNSMRITRFMPEHGSLIKDAGVAMRKKTTSVVHMWGPILHDFVVETNEGTLGAKAGSYVAYDEVSGHVWPVDADYVAAHYEEARA